MVEYGDWDHSKDRVDDRFSHIEKTLDTIKANSWKMLWLAIGGLATLLGHAIVSYIQMAK